MKQLKHWSVILLVAILLATSYIVGHHYQKHPTVQPKKPTKVTTQPVTPAPASFNKQQYSLDDPSSIWVVVNKKRPLNPQSHVPANLIVPNIALRSNITSTEKYVRADMATALEAMVSTAKQQGINLNLQSGYRSYSFQTTLYNGYVLQQGQAIADTQSARPGYSEHQTGLAADLGGTTNPSCNVAKCFGDTLEGTWLAAHAYEYGFLVRYIDSKTAITGYDGEPWHIRYIGKDLAAEMRKSYVVTLEEFFGLPGGPGYNSGQ